MLYLKFRNSADRIQYSEFENVQNKFVPHLCLKNQYVGLWKIIIFILFFSRFRLLPPEFEILEITKNQHLERKTGQSLHIRLCTDCRGKSGLRRTGYLALSEGPVRVRKVPQREDRSFPLLRDGVRSERVR